MVSVMTSPVYALTRGRVDAKPGLDRLEKRKISCACLESNCDSVVAYPLAYSLYYMSYSELEGLKEAVVVYFQTLVDTSFEGSSEISSITRVFQV
jgi:hypothetical protein